MTMLSDSQSPSQSQGKFADMLARVKHGDPAAAQIFFERYRPYLRVICALQLPRLCQHREDASDIVQQTLIDAARGIVALRGQTQGEFEGWLATLLERNILQSVRRNTAERRDVRREAADLQISDSAQLVWQSLHGDQLSPESVIFLGEAALQLAEALEHLPEDQRTAIELRYLGQEPLKSIAEQMSMTTGAVAGHLRRGLENLRKSLPPDLGLSLQ